MLITVLELGKRLDCKLENALENAPYTIPTN